MSAPTTQTSPTAEPAYHGPQANKLTGHNYDGIEEFDNPTPGWWHAIFLSSIVFSLIYAVFWHGSVLGWSIHDEWDDAQKAEFAKIFGSVGELKTDQETILAQMSNQKFMAVAKATFIGNCAACHKRDGGGDVGVNLCDDNYKNVNKIEDIYKVITEGANAGAMPPWKNRLSSNERVIVAAYVASLRGTTPAIGKAPVPGDKTIDPWPKAAAPKTDGK
jgi:cytochrome c oxidase cbb3-type subunit 3